MPCALLFGCDKELVQRLASDQRWKVAVATHCEEGKASYSRPSPSTWNLIVDDCLHPPTKHIDPGKPDVMEGNENPTDEEARSLGIPSFQIPRSYLREATNAHGIRFCSGADEFHGVHRALNRRERHMPLEFNAVGPRATHLADFIHDFESSFGRYHLWFSSQEKAIYRDFYDQPIVTMGESGQSPDWLYLIDIPNKSKRLQALWRLCTRSAPKLWPDLYAGSFQPRHIRSLRERQSQLAAVFRAEMERIDGEVEEEEQFFAPFYNLLYIGDEALTSLVARTFKEVLHCEVQDLDEQVTADDWRTLDLRVQCNGFDAFVEVKGSTNRNAKIGDLEQFNDHYETASARYGEARSKVLVFNGKYGRPEAERLRDATFSSQVIDEAETRGITLVDTRDLLHGIDRIRNCDLTDQQFLESLARPGRLALPPDS